MVEAASCCLADEAAGFRFYNEQPGTSPVSKSPVNDEFLRRFVRSQQDLYAYILTLVPNIADAQDILQETAIALWAKADEFRLEEPFMPWASSFAWHQVRKFRLYQARRQRHVIALSDEALQALATERAGFDASTAGREQILKECVERLTDDDRLLLRQRYDQKTPLRQVAADCGVEPAHLYKRLGRIRRTLVDCIDRTTAEDQHR
jgi:RNA polymerase sigma-70 factor, ECF subfamily